MDCETYVTDDPQTVLQ